MWVKFHAHNFGSSSVKSSLYLECDIHVDSVGSGLACFFLQYVVSGIGNIKYCKGSLRTLTAKHDQCLVVSSGCRQEGPESLMQCFRNRS